VVKLDEVNRMARRLLDPSLATIVVAGPWSGPADGRAEVLRAPDAAERADARGASPA
jgi:hypothetical protein